MSAPTERADPDFKLQAAWLAQLSDSTGTPPVSDQSTERQRPKRIEVSSEPVDRAVEQQHVPLSLISALQRRPGLLLISLIGFIVLALPLTIFTPQLSEIWRETAGGHVISGSPDPSMSANPGVRDELESPKLLVQPSQGVAGEPVPIGLTVRGRTEGAVVIITGLLPRMELSAGRALAGDAWQLSTSDLQYAWLAPPEGFIGSADLVAELRLSNDKIADRRAIHLEWTTPISPAPARPEPDRESPQSTGAGITVESRVEPETTNPTCFASASAVRQDHPDAWPSWTLRAIGHEGTKCWYPTTRTLAHDHPK